MDIEQFLAPALIKQERQEQEAYDRGEDCSRGDFGAYRRLLKTGKEDWARLHAIMDAGEAQAYAEQIRKIAGLPATALDIGCGPGVLTEALRYSLASYVMGIDGSQDAILYARDRFPHCDFRRFWVENSLPGTFDLIHARSFYPFARTNDQEAHQYFLELMMRHLTPRGKIILHIHGKDVFTGSSRYPTNRHIFRRYKLQRYPLSGATSFLLGVLTAPTYFYEVSR